MSWEIIDDIAGERALIERIIRKNGNNSEHNYHYFISHNEDANKCVFLRNGSYGIQATFNKAKKTWITIGTVMAPMTRQKELFYDALAFLNSRQLVKKVVAEFTPDVKKAIADEKNPNFRVHHPSYALYWPVYDMKSWTGDSLKGKEWKKLRNLINRIKKNHRVRYVDAQSVDREKLKSIIHAWVKSRGQLGRHVNRKDSNRTYYESYLATINNGFEGFKFAKAVLLDGLPVSLAAGWEIPNSDRAYYSGLGVYDLKVPCLGEYANWRDLSMLKSEGYKKVDFGGSPKPLLQFKNKFKPR